MEQIFQAINVYIAFAAVVMNIAFVVLVLARTSRTRVYIIFLFMCVASIVWNFGIFMTHFAGQGFWYYIALTGSPMLPALMYHFVNVLVRPVFRSKWIILAYILSGLLSISAFLAIFDPVIRGFYHTVYWNLYYICVLFPFAIGGMFILGRAVRNAQSSEERNPLRNILFALIIGAAMGVTELVQIFGIPIPKMGHLGFVLYASIIFVVIFRNRKTYDILTQIEMKIELLSQMAASIAHEIRTPLSSIKGASNLLSSELNGKGTPRAGEFLDIIREEIERVDNILINFQDLTKPMNIEKDSVSINDVIRKTVKLAEVGALSVTVKESLETDLPMVQTDAALLKQVFLNLIKNASEGCGAKGKLVIKTEYARPWVKITFRDNGPGISPEFLGHIFEPFFTTKSSGMGMGLAIAQRIVQEHKGRIEVRNAMPRGAEFSVFLPV